jgi:hypothetical protein
VRRLAGRGLAPRRPPLDQAQALGQGSLAAALGHGPAPPRLHAQAADLAELEALSRAPSRSGRTCRSRGARRRGDSRRSDTPGRRGRSQCHTRDKGSVPTSMTWRPSQRPLGKACQGAARGIDPRSHRPCEPIGRAARRQLSAPPAQPLWPPASLGPPNSQPGARRRCARSGPRCAARRRRGRSFSRWTSRLRPAGPPRDLRRRPRSGHGRQPARPLRRSGARRDHRRAARGRGRRRRVGLRSRRRLHRPARLGNVQHDHGRGRSLPDRSAPTQSVRGSALRLVSFHIVVYKRGYLGYRSDALYEGGTRPTSSSATTASSCASGERPTRTPSTCCSWRPRRTCERPRCGSKTSPTSICFASSAARAGSRPAGAGSRQASPGRARSASPSGSTPAAC